MTDKPVDEVDPYDVSIPRHLGMPKVENGYLPFDCRVTGPKEWHISAQPQLHFRPEVLIMWGYDENTMIHGIYVGTWIQGAASFGELPASFFGTARTYERILEDLKTKGISTPSWLTFKTVEVGQVVSIRGIGKLRNVVMLGKMV